MKKPNYVEKQAPDTSTPQEALPDGRVKEIPLREVQDASSVIARVNTLRRNIPDIAAGVDLAANKTRVESAYGQVLIEHPPGDAKAAEMSEKSQMMFGLERMYHMIYDDREGGKLMRFLFGKTPLTLLSRASSERLGEQTSGLEGGEQLRGGGRVDKVLGNQDYTFLNKGVPVIGSWNAPSAFIVFKPDVMSVEGARGFFFEDTDMLGKWAMFAEKSGDKIDDETCRNMLRSLMLDPKDVDKVRLTVGLAAPYLLDYNRYIEEEVRRRRLNFEDSSIRRGAIIAQHMQRSWPVESRLFSPPLNPRFNYSVADRILDDEDDDLSYLPGLTQYMHGEAEIIVPEGIGPNFIKEVVVRDDLMPLVAERLTSTGLTVGGIDFRSSIVPFSKYSQRIETKRLNELGRSTLWQSM